MYKSTSKATLQFAAEMKTSEQMLVSGLSFPPKLE